MPLSKATYIAFQGNHLYSFQSLLSLGIESMTLALQAPTLYCLSNRKDRRWECLDHWWRNHSNQMF